MSDVVKELMVELLKSEFPISRVRVKNLKHNGIKTKGNFKRAVSIGDFVYAISNYNERYKAMRTLTSIMVRAFNTSQEDIEPIVKKHLHIK
jgi:hypothetical protein